MKTYEFDCNIVKHESKDATFIEFPYDVEKEFNKKGQVKVKATFDGCEYRGSLAKMGTGCHILGMTKDIRNKINKQAGDTVHVILIEDIEPRIVEIPEDLKKLFDENIESKEFFQTLSYTNQKTYVQWIESAKKIDTRTVRLNKTIELLKNNIKRP